MQGEGILESKTHLAMMLMPGSDLNEVMVNRESYKYSGQWPKLFAKQLCMAVASMHQKNVAWRDAAPGNVQCTAQSIEADPGVVVFDFGVSVILQDGPQLSLDKVRVTGTPAYMAPEAVRGRQAQDKQPDSKAEREKTASLGSYDALKADAWGVGAIIFYAATGHQLLFDGIESVASSGSHAFSAAAHQTPTLQPGHAASAAAGPRTPDDHAGSQPVLKSGSGDTAKNSGSSDAFINDMLLEEHSRCKDNNLQPQWDHLLKVTNDSALLTMLQRLLNYDVTNRSTVAEVLHDPNLASVEGSPPDNWWVPAVQDAALETSPTCGPKLPLLPEMGAVEGLQPVPGMGSVYWRPGSASFCVTATGAVHRAWVVDSKSGWQNCMLKVAPLRPVPNPDAPTEGRPKTVLRLAAQINTGTSACLRAKGHAGIPDIECAFSDDVHYTLFRLPAGEVLSLQAYLDSRSSRSLLDFRQLSKSLLKMLDGLHSCGHFLGTVLPERILLQPELLVLEFATGDWLPSFSGMQRIDMSMWMKHQDTECSLQAASSAASDIWSLGVLLFELATGHLPFPGKLKRQVDSANELTDQERVEFFQSVAKSIGLQKELASCVGRAAADMVLSLLVPNSKKRLSAAAALQLPFFLQPDADSVQPSDSVQLLTADAQVCVSKKMFTAGTDTSALPGSLAKPDEKPGVSSAVAPANSPVSLVASAQDSSGMQTILTDSSAPSAKAVLTEQPCMPGQAHSGVQMASDDGNSSCSTPGDAPPPESHSTQGGASDHTRGRGCAGAAAVLRRVAKGTCKAARSCKAALSPRRWCCAGRPQVAD